MIRLRPLLLAILLAVASSPAHAVEQVRVGMMSLEAPNGYGAQLQALAVESQNILPRLESDLGVRADGRFYMVLIPAGGAPDSGLRALDATVPWWAAGYTVPERRLCVIRMSMAGRYPNGSIEAVLAHEATHLLIHDAHGPPLPLWFEEGVATWEGRRWEFRDVVAYSTSLLTADLPKLAELDSSFHASAAEAQLAYAGSHAFVARTIHTYGPNVVRDLLRASRTEPFPRAWERVTGTTLARAETDWRRASLIRYRWIPVLTASSTLWIGITLLSVGVGMRKRAAQRRVREQWAREEREAQEPIEPWFEGDQPWIAPGSEPLDVDDPPPPAPTPSPGPSPPDGSS